MKALDVSDLRRALLAAVDDVAAKVRILVDVLCDVAATLAGFAAVVFDAFGLASAVALPPRSLGNKRRRRVRLARRAGTPWAVVLS